MEDVSEDNLFKWNAQHSSYKSSAKVFLEFYPIKDKKKT